jgi:hypothetical protein
MTIELRLNYSFGPLFCFFTILVPYFNFNQFYSSLCNFGLMYHIFNSVTDKSECDFTVTLLMSRYCLISLKEYFWKKNYLKIRLFSLLDLGSHTLRGPRFKLC